MKPALCIVVPVLHEAERIARCLSALAPLRERGAKVVVVEGGSSDQTLALAQPLADVVLCAARGRACQMNAGAAACEASAYLFLHADTQLPVLADQRLLAALQGGALWGRFDVEIDPPATALRLVAGLMNWRSRISGIATGDQAIFVRADAWKAVHGFADLPLMEDIDLSSRLKRIGRPACLSERVLTSARRWEKHGVWRTVWLMWRLRLAYFFGADPGQLAQRYEHAR
jgi:rSAM/selenodomain-associated transferase 2